MGKFLRRKKPAPEPSAFAFIPMAAGFGILGMLKLALVGMAAVYVGYLVGEWQGQTTGYNKRDQEVAEVTRQHNAAIEELNAKLTAARDQLETSRDERSVKIVKSLIDIPKAVRDRCASDCSLPADTIKHLEAIE